MRETPPCKNCEDRHVGCHVVCEKYKSWSDKHAKEMQHLRDEREKEDLLNRYASEVGKRMKKSRSTNAVR